MSFARSLTIFLVIELAAVNFQVNAFSLQRVDSPGSGIDLTPAESSYVETREQKNSIYVTAIDDKNDEVQKKIMPIETTAKTEEIQKSNTTASTENTSETLSSNTEDEAQDNSTAQKSSTETISTGNTGKTTSSDKYENELNTEAQTNSIKSSVGDRDEQTTTENESLTDKLNNGTSENYSHDAYTFPENLLNKEYELSTSVTTDEHVPETKTEESSSASYSTEPVVTNQILTSNQSSSILPSDGTRNTAEIIQVSDTTTSVDDTTGTSNGQSENIKKTSESYTETLNTQQSSSAGVPFLKKYTDSERRSLSSHGQESPASTTLKDLVIADTAQSRVTLEKAFSVTSDIPSLERLKNELIMISSNPSTTRSLKASTAAITTADDKGTSILLTSPEATEFTSTAASDEPTSDSTRLLTSQRAGFLDLSSKTVASDTETTSIHSETMTIENNTLGGNWNETESTTTEVDLLNKKPSEASQTQLAEDAMNEELMKEEMLNNKDNLEFTKQFREERYDARKDDSENRTTVALQNRGSTIQDFSAEDKLSVKPISPEKPKNNSIYTINPNYKPLKKLDVQQPKPFVRDPDDNSWRNESLSSLGIVFKAKNSSKPFTQVLKNKTESELNTLIDKFNKEEALELRDRLEKIAEMRKSKKKKIDKFGETVYTDYEENGGSGEGRSGVKDISKSAALPKEKLTGGNQSAVKLDVNKIPTAVKNEASSKIFEVGPITTVAPKANKHGTDSFDGTDEDEAEYITFNNIDLKKFMTSIKTSEAPTTKSITTSIQPTQQQYLPDRRPTIQYFPPRPRQKVNMNDYDDNFQRKVNEYTTTPTTTKAALTYSTDNTKQKIVAATEFARARPTVDVNKLNYRTNDPAAGHDVTHHDGGFNKASYIIRHLKDYINHAAKDSEEDKISAFIITEPPKRVIPNNGLAQEHKKPDYEDYETQFHRDVLNRFVDNFNQNSERFKVDYPILYNSSIVHKPAEGSSVHASSSAFLKRLYDDANARQQAYIPRVYDPTCDRLVELSPDYELHYYVPEQEEREEMQVEARSRAPPQYPPRYRIHDPSH